MVMVNTDDALAQQDGAAEIEEIIVTATRRESSLQDIPFSISAVTGVTIQRFGFDDVEDYVVAVPGMEFSETGFGQRAGVNITLRGIANRRLDSFVGDPTAANTTTYYVDNYWIEPVDPKLFDVNRIEILKGPQGTLQGAAAMGGSVTVITNQPDSTAFDGLIDLSTSTTKDGGESFFGDIMLNMPLVSDVLAARMVLSKRKEGGWIEWRPRPLNPNNTQTIDEDIFPANPGILLEDRSDNLREDANDADAFTARLSLRYTPNENITLTPTFMIQESTVEIDNFRFKTLPVDYAHDMFLKESRTEDFYLVGLTAESSLGRRGPLGDLSVVSVTGYTNRIYGGVQDLTLFAAASSPLNQNGSIPGPFPFTTNREAKIFTQELRVQGQAERFNWVVGGYFADEVVDRAVIGNTNQWNQNADNNNFLGDENGIFFTASSELDYQSISFFVDAAINLTDKLEVAAGVRYTDQDFSANTTSVGSVPGQIATSHVTQEDGFTPRFSIKYDLNQDVMVYASASEGFRIGDTGSPQTIPACIDALDTLGIPNTGVYESDSVVNYEVGVKSLFLNERAMVNLSVFQVDWEDVQQGIQLDRINIGCISLVTLNVGTATVEGFDLEYSVFLTDRLEVAGNVARTHARLDAPPAEASNIFNEGARLGGVPDWAGNLRIRYARPLFGTYEGFLQASVSYRDKIWGPNIATQTNPLNIHDAYTTVNLRAGITNDDWGFGIFVNNAFDEIGDIGGGPLFGDPSIGRVLTIRPFTVGVQFSIALDFFE